MATSLTGNTLTLNDKALTAPEFGGVISTTSDYCYAGGNGSGTYTVNGPHGKAPQIGSVCIAANSSRSSGGDGTVSLSGSWFYVQAFGISSFTAKYGTVSSITMEAGDISVAVRIS